MTSMKNKPLMIGLGVVALLAVGYFLFSGSSSDVANVTTGVATSPAELYFINLAGELETVEFDTSVLSDARFIALTDISTNIVPGKPGRPDPFAPISGVGAQ